jgi:hypothetical protein
MRDYHKSHCVGNAGHVEDPKPFFAMCSVPSAFGGPSSKLKYLAEIL